MIVGNLSGTVGVAPGTTTLRVFNDTFGAFGDTPAPTPEQGALAELVRYHKTQVVLQVITTVSLATLAGLSILAILRDGLSTRAAKHTDFATCARYKRSGRCPLRCSAQES